MKIRKTALNSTDEDFLRWLAGFFDGEGCITITKRDELYVTVGGNFVEILKDLEERFGGSISGPRGKNRKAWQWQIVSNVALRFLESIRPYSILKRKEISIGIEFQQDKARLSRYTPKDIKSAELLWREDLRNRLSFLNRARKVRRKLDDDDRII